MARGRAEHRAGRLRGRLAAPGGLVRVPPPLRFEDEFEVHIRVAELNAARIRYRCLLSRGDERIATGALTIVCVSKRPDEPMQGHPHSAGDRGALPLAPTP